MATELYRPRSRCPKCGETEIEQHEMHHPTIALSILCAYCREGRGYMTHEALMNYRGPKVREIGQDGTLRVYLAQHEDWAGPEARLNW